MSKENSTEPEGGNNSPQQATGDLTAIVAMTPSGVIGRDGDMPWRLSSDLRRFKRLTMGGTLIMGRRTFDSIGRPLPGRRTIVVTRNPDWSVEGVTRAASPLEALQMAGVGRPAAVSNEKTEDLGNQATSHETGYSSAESTGRVFVVGGAEIYRQLLPKCTYLYLTRVLSGVEGDTKLEIDLSEFRLIEQTRFPATARDDVPTEFLRLIRRNS